jgi:hypothetical protein
VAVEAAPPVTFDKKLNGFEAPEAPNFFINSMTAVLKAILPRIKALMARTLRTKTTIGRRRRAFNWRMILNGPFNNFLILARPVKLRKKETLE